MLELITSGDESAYRQEGDVLGLWCRQNNLTVNHNKTKEMMVDFWKNSTVFTPTGRRNKNRYAASGQEPPE